MAHRWSLPTLFLSLACRVAWAQDPTGVEFQVNSYTPGWQSSPATDKDASGSLVVVWVSADGGNGGIFGRRFNAAGVSQGSEFQVNSYTTGSQAVPAVASDVNGNFVVVWESSGQDGSSTGVFGQRFSASGLPQGSEFQINSYTTGYQSHPGVASDANGDFVVVWQSYQDGNGLGVFGQRFNASGSPQGSEFQVNSYATSEQSDPAVTADASGNFVVVWRSWAQDGSDWGIFGRRFNAGGVPQGSDFQINSHTSSAQYFPSVASDAIGNFVVVWESSGQDGSGFGVFGQRFDALGVRQGSEFQVNSYTTSQQYHASVASGSSGRFVVAWTGSGQDGNGFGIFGQRFNVGGVPQGSEFQINSYSTGDQMLPAVATDAIGNFVVAWQSNGQDGSDWGVFGQRYGDLTDLIFRDGFE